MESNTIDICSYLVNFLIFALGFVLFSIAVDILTEVYKKFKD